MLDGRRVAAASGFLAACLESGGKVFIEDIAPEYEDVPLQTLELGGKAYLAYTRSLEGTPDSMLKAVSFVPLGVNPGEAGVFGSVAVMLAVVDNFEDAIESAEEIRRPVLIALIDRRINVLAGQLGAIVKKYEKDKFLMILTEDKLKLLMERSFEPLSSIRDIDVGNRVPVTLSVGVGLNGGSPARCMEYARAAVDLALGRGGDQVLVKDRERYIFFGGAGPEIPDSGRVKARVKLRKLIDCIDDSTNVLVMGHHRADMDSLGAAVGVYKLASLRNRVCRILIGESASGVSAIYGRLTEEGYAGVFVSEKDAFSLLNDDTLVVVVDANRPSVVESPELLRRAGTLAVIDHHRLAADFIDNAVLTYQEPCASSACELICEMLRYAGDVRLKPVEADLMLAGITVDTKGFTQKTGAKTFDAAAYLRRAGADSIRVKTYLQEELDDIQAMAAVISSVEILGGRVAVSLCAGNTENPVQVSARAADELLNISGVEASFVLCESDGAAYISARSLGKLNVQLIMERLGGGGHQTIAAAQLSGITIIDAREALFKEINQYLRDAAPNSLEGVSKR